MKYLNMLALMGMLMNITLNYFLIPDYKALGSAYASLITQFFICIWQLVVVVFIFNLRINYKYVFSITLFVIVAFLTSWLSKLMVDNWILGLALFVVLSLSAAMALKLVKIRMILSEFKKS